MCPHSCSTAPLPESKALLPSAEPLGSPGLCLCWAQGMPKLKRGGAQLWVPPGSRAGAAEREELLAQAGRGMQELPLCPSLTRGLFAPQPWGAAGIPAACKAEPSS